MDNQAEQLKPANPMENWSPEKIKRHQEKLKQEKERQTRLETIQILEDLKQR